LLFDNLSRPGAERNWQMLRDEYGCLVELQTGDVRDASALKQAVSRASKVFHFASQVAVASSVKNPVEDFEINARGTLNLLEILRELPKPLPLICTSTSKIYGDLADIRVRSGQKRCEPEDPACRLNGFSEARPLRCHSPHGCSNGAACQYVLDYARTFKVPAVVFCVSSVYGPHQLGTEDQGWITHFLNCALKGGSLTVYGDGRQVRDVLFVDDLMEAFLLADDQIARLSGQTFNIGGGPDNTLSVIELLELIATIRGARPKVQFEPARLSDQRYYVSDIRKFSRATGWCPSVGVREGIERLCRWLESETAASPGREKKRAAKTREDDAQVKKPNEPLEVP
jgi:CDP-paratose 2-epimerase